MQKLSIAFNSTTIKYICICVMLQDEQYCTNFHRHDRTQSNKYCQNYSVLVLTR